MLLSSNSLPPKKKDAFTSVAIAVCIIGQIAMENHSFDHIQAALKCIIAISIAPSIGRMVITDLQLAH
jgi:divalent metal cation (Fe/Co/Zn/Cd) transporter